MSEKKKLYKRIKAIFKPKPDTRVALWEQHKLLYVRVPKCANTSIMQSIEDTQTKHMWSDEISTLDDAWTTFSFVRNPWARIVSAYSDKIRGDTGTQPMVNGVYEGFLSAGIPVYEGMSFAEFCEVVCDIPDEKIDRHLRSQASFLMRDGKPIVHIIGRLEDMDRDWRSIMDAAGLDFPLRHLNRAKRRHYGEYFGDRRLINLVGDRYAEDERCFNYDFEGAS